MLSQLFSIVKNRNRDRNDYETTFPQNDKKKNTKSWPKYLPLAYIPVDGPSSTGLTSKKHRTKIFFPFHNYDRRTLSHRRALFGTLSAKKTHTVAHSTNSTTFGRKKHPPRSFFQAISHDGQHWRRTAANSSTCCSRGPRLVAPARRGDEVVEKDASNALLGTGRTFQMQDAILCVFSPCTFQDEAIVRRNRPHN